MKISRHSLSRRRSRVATTVIALLAAGFIASGCGVPIDATAHALPKVKFNRTATNTNTTTTIPQTGNDPQKSYVVYFLLHGVLTPVQRPDPQATSAATPPIAIASLDNGPNAQELAEGYISALSAAPGAQISDVGITNGIISVALNSNFVNLLLGPTLPQAYGQIVLTLVDQQFPNVTAVQFVYDGAELGVLLPNGTIKATPVKLCDYAQIAIERIKKTC